MRQRASSIRAAQKGTKSLLFAYGHISPHCNMPQGIGAQCNTPDRSVSTMNREKANQIGKTLRWPRPGGATGVRECDQGGLRLVEVGWGALDTSG
jgi:hypothetical protein